MALNKFIGIGNLGRDAEVRMAGASKVANFSIAISEKWKDQNGQQQEKTEWVNLVAWKGLADVAEKFFKKGVKLYVEGKLVTRSFDKEGQTHYRTEIVLQNFEFCGGQQAKPQQQPYSPGGAQAQEYNQEPPVNDDDLPF